ncbi:MULTISPECIES: nodulation protein NfeD [unclassified Guyparkeria]|uniref:NfeD family protein n=1 Tax=unclassified Guyparkeria TaxID=2626246 RepID=UPI0007334E3B|nr:MULTISPECIES: nodulation protein NfeD [unclassified Guyparkeria]KTG17469.1 serine protease [Guyparkeria sp. XI15]OAE87446.1 serine protease [Guyparkeria sp. WRN-7]
MQAASPVGKVSRVVWRRLAWLLVGLAGLAWLLVASAQDRPREAIQLTVQDAITPATADYVIRGIESAETRGAELVVLQLDTPGGLDSSMRSIIQAILQARVPVASYVHPAGARAASAGTYILYGSPVAAMTPSTNLGSATPVQLGGGGLPGMPSPDEGSNGNGEGAPAEAGTAMERKVLEDAVAYIRGLAERHGRNADWAERAVREGANLGAREALEQNVIDIVAKDVADLLAQLDGREVLVGGTPRTLSTEEIEVVREDPGWRTELLAVITNPNIAYILLLIGIYGIIFELANPGAIVPGTIGAIALILAFFALQVMPLNYAGLALILLGIVFMIAEAFVPSFGALGIGGLAAFTAGSIMLWDDPNLNIALPLIIGVAIGIAGFSIWVLGRFLDVRRKKPATGYEEMVGMEGTAREDFDDTGRVWVHSELWNARARAPVRSGQTVRVVAIDGLTLTVEPAE